MLWNYLIELLRYRNDLQKTNTTRGANSTWNHNPRCNRIGARREDTKIWTFQSIFCIYGVNNRTLLTYFDFVLLRLLLNQRATIGTKDLEAILRQSKEKGGWKNPLFGSLFSFSLYWVVTPDSFGEEKVKLPNYCVSILFTPGDFQSQKQRHLSSLSS